MRVAELLKKRRDRAIAIILNVKEREVDPILMLEGGGPHASRLMRKVILDQINDFYDLALDIATSGEADKFEFNPELWERRLNQISEGIADLQAQADHDGP